MSEDPIGFKSLDSNMYKYVFNNPLNNIDPYGYKPGVFDIPDFIDPNGGAFAGAVIGGGLAGAICGPICGFVGGIVGGFIGGQFTPDSGELGIGSDVVPREPTPKPKPKCDPRFQSCPPSKDFFENDFILEQENQSKKKCDLG